MFRQLGLIGCGLMGGSFALAVRQAGLVERVVGYSPTARSRDAALALGAIDAGVDTPAAAIHGSDLVLLALPVASTEATLRAICDALAPETLVMDVEDQHQGSVMEYLGTRRADMTNMESDGKGRVRLDYRVPARGLIGFHNEFLNLTRGTGIMSHVFDAYGPMAGPIEDRRNGVLISGDDGEAVAYALWKLDDRGRMFVSTGEALYEGMVIGIHTRDNDLVVNPVREKKLTNVRSSGKDDAIVLTPPIQLTLEKAVEFIAEDELVEITPKSIRLRKRHLKEHERKRASRDVEVA
jgi:GTP-binding protein